MKARPLKKRNSLDVPKGWRLLAKGEIVPMDAKFKIKGYSTWSNTVLFGYNHTYLGIDYITRK